MDTDSINIRVFDRKLNLIGELDGYTALIFTSKWNNYGSFEIHLAETSPGVLQVGNYIMLNNDPYKTGIIKYSGITEEAEESSAVIKGFTLAHIFTQRLTVPPKGQEYYTVKGSVEDIMYNIVDANTIHSVEPGRIISNLDLRQSQGRGQQMTFQTRYKCLADELESLSVLSGLGIAVTIDPVRKKFFFEVCAGTDRTIDQETDPPTVFNPDYDNVLGRSYTTDLSGLKNCAYTAGQGEGADRAVHIVGGGNTGIDRYEMFVDARDIENDSDLEDRGKTKLAENAGAESYECTVETADYEKRWFLGDFVTVVDRGLSVQINKQVLEVREERDSSGYTVAPTFGTAPQTIIDMIRKSEAGYSYYKSTGANITDITQQQIDDICI